ncbi:MAG: putative transporter [Candidatus Accumulibacter regalis]|jgi:fucose permease|uniref:Transporter n=1 Tax=Accumulibacter regalis TaxID=522306 RepID=A0A011QGQ0_ACCRE|nr:MFS transporter [Accumulibacter sp.]EXI88462.1 MAG: putative transporter [Candidatus Accumulibacter regalis]MBN8513127.1 MFS transporter [Accumulibacter sp.]MBO3702467.1 MFS transporter [Accumulibacter sp.]HRE71039.1 MFS transporter [Accumulibacter sp.]HRE86556.1 MFS transporter [Accumulibacter sp.]
MAQRSEIAAVYLAGVAQGVALVTFPAASAVFTAAAGYGLSSTEYGGMFVPQAITAIGASLLGAGLARRLGAKRIYLLGLLANLLAMALLIVSSLVMRQHTLAYGLLLLATASLGVGFGFTVPTLNTLAAAFFPQRVDRAVLGLNALLGLGTALAPLFVALFVGLGIWWGLPLLVAVALVGLLLFSRRLTFCAGAPAIGGGNDAPMSSGLPARFWLFAAFALLYGVCETINANWASLYMSRELGASATMASLALTAFWGSVTGGRMLFAAIERFLPPRRSCQLLPWVVAGALIGAALLPRSDPLFGIATFALAGLGCSALLPLAISFGQQQLPGMASSVAGGLIAFYQMGYGIAAFGVGPLQGRLGLDLNVIYGATTAVALGLAALAVLVVRSPQRRPSGP